MGAALYPRLRAVSPRPQQRRGNARAVAAIWLRLRRGGTSEADKPPHCSGSPIASRRTPRCGPRETADMWGHDALARERALPDRQKNRPGTAASLPPAPPPPHPPPPPPPPPHSHPPHSPPPAPLHLR